MITAKESHAPVKNDPRLFRLVGVRVLRAFFAVGTRLEPGAITTLPYYLAMELQVIGKVELIP